MQIRFPPQTLIGQCRKTDGFGPFEDCSEFRRARPPGFMLCRGRGFCEAVIQDVELGLAQSPRVGLCASARLCGPSVLSSVIFSILHHYGPTHGTPRPRKADCQEITVKGI